jgi:tetratricopeptide (TPR) repeat protein
MTFHGLMGAVFVCVMMIGGAHHANANALYDCLYEPSTQKRLTGCNTVINDPASMDTEKAQALEMRARQFSIERKFPEAMQDLNQSLQLNPNSDYALNGRAWTLFRWKKTDEGMNDVSKALEIAPMSAPAWDTRAHLHQLRGEFEKAFTEYEAAIGFGGEPFIRTYQCGLRERGLYKGQINGIYSVEMRTALRKCAFSKSCDPLPENEFVQECDGLTS